MRAGQLYGLNCVSAVDCALRLSWQRDTCWPATYPDVVVSIPWAPFQKGMSSLLPLDEPAIKSYVEPTAGYFLLTFLPYGIT